MSAELAAVIGDGLGRGLPTEIDALSVRQAVITVGAIELRSDQVTGSLTLRLVVEGAGLRLAVDISKLILSGLSVQPA